MKNLIVCGIFLLSSNMLVRDVMQKKVITVKPSTTYREAAEILYKNQISGVIVVNESGQIVGVLSEKDLFRVLYPHYKSFYEHPEHYIDFESREDKIEEVKDQPIEKYMSSDIISIPSDSPIMKAGGLMLAHNVHRIPVVDDGKLVGIVSRDDIFKKILEMHLDL